MNNKKQAPKKCISCNKITYLDCFTHCPGCGYFCCNNCLMDYHHRLMNKINQDWIDKINQHIKIQKKFLGGKHDKAVQWRITGLKILLKDEMKNGKKIPSHTRRDKIF